MTRINYTTETLGNLTDVLTNDAFKLQFTSIPNASAGPTDLLLRCKAVTLPELSNEKVQVDIHGFQMNFRGRRRQGTGDMQVTFTEFKDVKVSTALRQWHEYVVGTASGNSGGYKSDYSTMADLSIFDTTGAEVLKYRCFNTFITSIPELSLDSSQQAAVEIQATFSIDYYRQMNINLL